jgi:hypothetical protein
MGPRDSRTLLGALGRHAVHPFPARMAPEIVCSFLDRAKTPMRVFDPMMGSGTVIALAQSRKHRAVGIDIDPLAALTARVLDLSNRTELGTSQRSKCLETRPLGRSGNGDGRGLSEKRRRVDQRVHHLLV